MKHLKKFESYATNESKFGGFNMLPKEALEQLELYVDYKNPDNKIEVYPDPKVDGSYAVRVHRKEDNLTFDLLWYKGGFDEIFSEENPYGFAQWPPVSGELKFF